MVQVPDHITQINRKYLAALQAHPIPIQQVYLFGSYARGNYTEWSDIDLAIVSNIFEGNRMDDRHKIQKITLSISTLLEIHPYRPEDFTEEDPFVREILKTGIQII
jgi:predicted nucleotidyltransferase